MKKLIAIAALMALATPAAAQNDPNQVRADQGSNNRTITVRRGQYLQVSVDVCVGCPYGWRLTRLPTNLSLADVDEIDRTQRGGPVPIVGGRKTMVYTFYVERAGRGTLQLENRRFQGARDRNDETLRINVVTR